MESQVWLGHEPTDIFVQNLLLACQTRDSVVACTRSSVAQPQHNKSRDYLICCIVIGEQSCHQVSMRP